MPFDTVFAKEFKNETISNVAIADLEGDGLLDVIVTTYNKTYVIGSLLKGTLKIVEPKIQYNPPQEYCLGDTLQIKWENLIKTESPVNIKFIELDDNLNPINTIIVADRKINSQQSFDTVIFNYYVDTLLAGKTGYFRVELSDHLNVVWDVTSIIKLNKPSFNITSFPLPPYHSGDEVQIVGSAICVDSVSVEYSYDDIDWTLLSSAVVDENGSFVFDAVLPCPSYFNCTPPDSGSLVNFRYITSRAIVTDTSSIIQLDTSQIYLIPLLPQTFPIEWDVSTTADPTKYFKWDTSLFKFQCDTVSFLISTDRFNYTEMARIPGADGFYKWNLPTELPDTIIIRFCCENSCIRTDLPLMNFNPKYIEIVAPNPFNPPSETMEVVYSVPIETNVTIRIFDQSNRFVAEIVKDQPRMPKTIYCDRWNGYRWDGATADNGMYYLVIDLSKGTKEVYPVFIRK